MSTLVRLGRRMVNSSTWPGRWFSKPPVPNTYRSGQPTLVCEGLMREFGSGEGRTQAVDDVSFELRPGELNLLMGPSGSGKSTLLAVLSGLLRPDEGQVRALGQNLWDMSEDELERFRLKHCSYIFQGYNLFPALTARENSRSCSAGAKAAPAPKPGSGPSEFWIAWAWPARLTCGPTSFPAARSSGSPSAGHW